MGFSDAATAGNGTFFVNGGTGTGPFDSSVVRFFPGSTAGNATLTANGSRVSNGLGGVIAFQPKSSAGAATLIANGGTGDGKGGSIVFNASSQGGSARVQVSGNGNLNISPHHAPGVTIGSLEGNGDVFLGANNLSLGANNLDTTFSGVIQDAGALSKIGAGKLTVTSANTYTGGTTVKKGSLLVKNKTGSATGAGAVQITGGTLGGTGTISGAVTVGNGTASGAILLPGRSITTPGALTINNALTFNPLSTYECALNRTSGKVSNVSALGVTIKPNATFSFINNGPGTLTTGTILTVINNSSANPIIGIFSNLPDGSTFTSAGTTFKATYEGGDGNDLTLTVQ